MISNSHVMRLIPAILLFSLAQSAVAEFDHASPAEPIQLADVIVTAEVNAEEVWKLKESGKIMSLEDLISQVRRDYPGRIIEIDLDDEDGRYVYELELVDEKGMAYELEVDANTGQVLKYEQDD